MALCGLPVSAFDLPSPSLPAAASFSLPDAPAALGVITAAEKAEDTSPVIQTAAGSLRGTAHSGIARFLNIPYASAGKRFLPAGPVQPWKGIRDASQYGPISPQGTIPGLSEKKSAFPSSNDCQNLNIWTPSGKSGEKKPVMVWLHGGGFSTGSANLPEYDGENLSRAGDLVVVSINHRLNVFGHLDLSAYGPEYKDSANAGIADIVSALQWIHSHIADFGGDPHNVTLFGQSGGGAKILALMASPYAEGLFQKAIIQSGTTETMGASFTPRTASRALTKNFLSILHITPDQIDRLQTLPEEVLENAAARALEETGKELRIPAALGSSYSMDWEPVVDGDFLPSNPVTDRSFAAAGKNVTLLIGSNLKEWTGTFRPDYPNSPAVQKALKEAYPEKTDLTPSGVDTLIRLPTRKIILHKVRQEGAPVYSYLFVYGDSHHSAEIPYVFRHEETSPEAVRIADQMSRAWIHFARYGVPAAEGLPLWKPVSEKENTMIFDTAPRLAAGHDAKLLSLLAPSYTYFSAL